MFHRRDAGGFDFLVFDSPGGLAGLAVQFICVHFALARAEMLYLSRFASKDDARSLGDFFTTKCAVHIIPSVSGPLFLWLRVQC